MFWWVFDLFFCIKGATASGDQKWTWPMLKLLYNRESSLVLSVPRGVGWRGGEGDSRGRRCESESCSIVSNSLWPHGLYGPWNSPGQNTEVGVAFPFSRGSSQPRDQTQVSHIAGRFFTSWATREAWENIYIYIYIYTHTKTHTYIYVVIFQASWGAFPILISFYLLQHYTFFLKTGSFMTCFLPKA